MTAKSSKDTQLRKSQGCTIFALVFKADWYGFFCKILPPDSFHRAKIHLQNTQNDMKYPREYSNDIKDSESTLHIFKFQDSFIS